MVRSYEFIPVVIDVKVLVSSGGFIPVIMVEEWEPDRRPVFVIMYLLHLLRIPHPHYPQAGRQKKCRKDGER